MKNKLKRLSVALLSFVTVFALTVPALAVPSDNYAVLNIRYRPDNTPVNGVEYRLYKVADAKDQGDGTYTYTLTAPFAPSGIDVDAILKGGQLTTGDNRDLLVAFGTYINNNQETVRDHAITVKTAAANIGTDQHQEDGIARFTGLEDGLYLVTSSETYTVGRTTYTPVPFLLRVPYVVDGVVNNYLTANVKFTSYTPTTPRDPDPTNPTNPTDPDEPPVDIDEPDVPLVDLPEEPDPDVEIPDEEPPLAELPQTGLLWWPVPVLAAAGVLSVALGLFQRKKDGRDG